MYPLKIDEKYNQSNLDNLGHRFTTLYSGNYISGDFNEGVGSHPGVDIFPPNPHSNVFCVLDGVVEKTGEDGAYGNFIIIKHNDVLDPDNFTKKTNLYSCYLHLTEINIKKGDNITEGSIIGKTGNTGMSFGEHLHFQIDRENSPYHAYWPYTGSQIQSLGINFLDGVNVKLGYDNLIKYTVNPLLYLDKLEQHLKITSKSEEKFKEVINKHIKNDKNTVKEITKTGDIIKESVIVKKVIKNGDSLDLSGSLDNLLSISVDDNLLKKDNKLDSIISTNTDIEVASIDDNLINTIVTKPVKINLEEKTNSVDTQIFTDLKHTDPYFNYINTLLLEGKISGFGDNTFRGQSFITRAELLKIIIKITDISTIINDDNLFNDIPNGSWYKKYVDTAIYLKIISTNNKNFRPNDRISRAEALKMVIKILNIDISNGISCEYLDVNGTEWYAKYVNVSCKYDLIPGVRENFFPNKNITRRELIGIFFNYNKNK